MASLNKFKLGVTEKLRTHTRCYMINGVIANFVLKILKFGNGPSITSINLLKKSF